MQGQQLQLDLFPQLPQQTEQADLSLSVPTRSYYAPVRAITLWQPWATLIALGFKCYETRRWGTSYTGDLIIHAAARKVKPKEFTSLLDRLPADLADQLYRTEYPLGACVAVVNLVHCWEMIDEDTDEDAAGPNPIQIESRSEVELTFGWWEAGRQAWQLNDVVPIGEPVSAKGQQGLWIPDRELLKKIYGQIADREPVNQLVSERIEP